MKPERAKIAGTTPRDPGAYSSLGGGGGVEKLLFRDSSKSGEKIGGKIFRRYDVFKMEFWDDLRRKNFYESWRLV